MNAPAIPKITLTIPEAAEATGLSPRTVEWYVQTEEVCADYGAASMLFDTQLSLEGGTVGA